MNRKTFRAIDGKRLRKYPKSKLLKRTKKVKPVTLKKVPTLISCIKATIQHMWRYKKPFAGILIIYIVLSLLFVKGLSSSVDIKSLRQELNDTLQGNTIYQNIILTSVVATSSSSSQSEISSVYQSILLVLFVLAYIWLFRASSADTFQRIKIRQPFYEGMGQLIPFLFVLFIVGLQCIPLLIGLGVFGIVQANGLAATTTELVLWALFALIFACITLYFLSSSVFALIIVTLNKEKPLQALKSARKLVAFRRLVLMRRIFSLVIVLFIVVAGLILFVISTIPVLAEMMFLLASALAIPLAIGTIYKMYRGML